MMRMRAQAGMVADSTSIDPGQQAVSISLSVSFELE